MYEHSWPRNETKIVQIGFVQGYDPNSPPERFEAEYRRRLFVYNQKTPPEFHSSPITVKNASPGLETIKARALSIECRISDAQKLISFIRKLASFETDSAPNEVMLYKTRHLNLNKFRESIAAQASFLDDNRMISIAGVSVDLMQLLEEDLLEIDGIDAILPHKETLSKGRWNLQTRSSGFRR